MTFTDDADNEETLTSAATVAVAAAANREATGQPTISGTPQVGQTLTADTANIVDQDGLTGVSYTYQWIAGGTDIDEATGSSYTLTASEQGQTIQVRVTFTDDADNEETLTSVATVAVLQAANREATGQPTISGTPQVGQTLTADTANIVDQDGLTGVSYTYQWIAGGSDIGGATGSTHALTASEQGKTIQVRVTFTDDRNNAETLTSVATVAVAAAANREATGQPAISGTPQVEETLTADTANIVDQDGLTGVSYSYQWIAGGTDIDGATGSTYALTASEQGQTIQVRVSFTDDRDNAESLTSEATGAVTAAAAQANNPPTGQPAISGTPQVDQTLTADTSPIDDADGLTGVSYSYQWIAGGSDIDGATGSTYTLTASEQGQTIQVRVSFTDDADNEETLTSKATVAVAAAPNSPATGAPTIGGTPQVEETLTADTSPIDDADGLTNVSYSYQWIAGGTDIDGATGSSYELTSSEQGQTIQVRVTFTDDRDNEETLTSAATVAVAAEPNTAAVGLPTISGTPQVGQTLTADTANIIDQDGLTGVSYSYQWIAGGTDIDEATGSSYTLTASEQGQTIQVRVTFTDDADNEETLTSVATVAVAAAANREATGQPTISGTPQVGQTLTADTTNIVDQDGLTGVSYIYQWIAGGSDIDGATGSTHTLTASEQGKTIQVRVTFTDDRNNAETLTSAATLAVAAKPVPLTATFSNVPTSHSGSGEFTFDLAFSENLELSYITLRDHAFTEDDHGPVTRGATQGAGQQSDLDDHRRAQRQRRNHHHAARDHGLHRRRGHLHQRRPEAVELDHGHHPRPAVGRPGEG